MTKKLNLSILLILFSFVIRFALISKGPYHVDCLSLAMVSQHLADNFQLKHQFGSGYPLTVILGALFIAFTRLFQITDPVYSVNLMSVVLSSLSVGVFYVLVERLLNKRTAVFAAVAFSLSPIFLGISVYGKSHIPSLFFLLLSVYFLTRNGEDRTIKDFWLSAVFMGFMGACRLQDMVLVAPAVTVYLMLGKVISRQLIRQVCLFLAYNRRRNFSFS